MRAPPVCPPPITRPLEAKPPLTRPTLGRLRENLSADYVVFGGGNVNLVAELPDGCRKGGNHNAYFGGLRMWDEAAFKTDDAG
jgi:hypothetical protein